MAFGLVLLVLKCLEKRRAAARDGQRPASVEDRHSAVTGHLQTAAGRGSDVATRRQSTAKRWRKKLDELLQLSGLLPATSHQSQLDDELPPV